jgi:leucine dehydrogenase
VFEDLLRAWDGEEVAVHYDAPTDTWMFVCVHSTVLGPAAGGTRMKVYDDPQDALRDGMRLGTAMTSKNAVAGLPLGGGKAVLGVPAIPTGEARREILLRYADLVESLHGTYWTACDMNTSTADMDVVGERCAYVFGKTEAAGGSGSSAPATAAGVFYGIEAAVGRVFGAPYLEGRTVLVQGVGAVGRDLAARLAHAGARLILTDVDEARAQEAATELGGEVIAPQDATRTECDVFSPCATGGVLSAETIPQLRCHVVAGAANNQLLAPEDAERFAERDIVYVPDFVVNAGGIIHIAAFELLDETSEQVDARVRGIADTVGDVLDLAAAEDISTEAAAEQMVQHRLALGRGN